MTPPLFIIWLLAFLSLPVSQEGGITLSAQAGYDALYEESAAVPVTVFIQNSGTAVEGEIRVSASGSAASDSPIYSAPITLPTGSDKRVPLVVHLPGFASGLNVQLVSDERVIAEAHTDQLNTVNNDELFYGIVTQDPGGLAFLETIPGRRTDAAVAFLSLADLPEVSSAWNALDIIVLDDTDTSRLTPGQTDAMRAWIEGGGQLVVTGGPGGPQTAAGVAGLLPVNVSGVESIDNLSGLTEYGGAPLESPGPYVITSNSLNDGEVIIEEDGLPILARRDLGRGSVYFLALDPKAAPLAGWTRGERLWERIAIETPSLPPWANGIRESYAATQAVSYIPGLRLPSIWQLLLFLLVYTAIIGPVNYLVLRRINRRELAWITIPVLILLFSAITFFTGFRTRGNIATLNVMSVVFGSADADQLRAQSIMGLYSPRRARYDISLPYNSAAFPFQDGFGTLSSATNLDTIDRASDITLSEVRTDTSEVATFIVDSHQSRPQISAEAALKDGGNAVEVIIRNDSTGTLENAVLIHGQDQTSLGDIPPGREQTVRVSLPATSPTTTSSSLFSPGTFYPNPLINDPSVILGTVDYFSDPVAYPRWQLIQAHYADQVGTADLPSPDQIVTLGGWMAGSSLEASVSGNANRTGETLLLLEIPVR